MGKMNIDPEAFAFKNNLEEERREDIPVVEENIEPEFPEEESINTESLLDRLFAGKITKKIEKVNRTYYLEREIVERLEEIAKQNDISSSVVVNDLLKEILFS